MKRIIVLLLALMLITLPVLAQMPEKDRAGNELTLSEAPTRIISLAPATTQIIESLNMLDCLVGVDSQSPLYVSGLENIDQFDMMAPDCERMASLEPQLVLVSGMSYADSEDPFFVLRELGVQVATIPTSSDIAGVMEDILFVAEVCGQGEQGLAIIENMYARIDKIKQAVAGVADQKRVLFEISALPYIYSTGTGTFLNEMIEAVGAVNVLSDQQGWLPVTEESAVAANPDVIFTSVNYIENSVGEIMNRPGWGSVAAVENAQVFYIDNAKCSLPNQFIVDAMAEMGALIYPELFGTLPDAA